MKRYSKNWHKPAVAKDIERYEQVDPDTKVVVLHLQEQGRALILVVLAG